jgi:hypothetical protein
VITCLFVTMIPDGSTRRPVPTSRDRCAVASFFLIVAVSILTTLGTTCRMMLLQSMGVAAARAGVFSAAGARAHISAADNTTTRRSFGVSMKPLQQVPSPGNFGFQRAGVIGSPLPMLREKPLGRLQMGSVKALAELSVDM